MGCVAVHRPAWTPCYAVQGCERCPLKSTPRRPPCRVSLHWGHDVWVLWKVVEFAIFDLWRLSGAFGCLFLLLSGRSIFLALDEPLCGGDAWGKPWRGHATMCVLLYVSAFCTMMMTTYVFGDCLCLYVYCHSLGDGPCSC